MDNFNRSVPLPDVPLRRRNHWYIVYDKQGEDVGYVQARSKLEADVRAEAVFKASFGGTAQTEL